MSVSPSELNGQINRFDELEVEERNNVTEQLATMVWDALEELKDKIKDETGKDELLYVNMIVGTTGVGKSTLTNYLKGNVLTGKKVIITEYKKGKKKHRKKNVLDALVSGLGPEIGITGQSQTVLPNLIEIVENEQKVMYADCPGEFDTKGLVQSICNARIKEYLATKAQNIKVTMVTDMPTLRAGKGGGLKRMATQIDGFMNLQSLLDNNSLAMVVTKVGVLKNEATPIEEVRGLLDDIVMEDDQTEAVRDYITDEDSNSLAVFCEPLKNEGTYVPYHAGYSATKIKMVLGSKSYMSQQANNFTVKVPAARANTLRKVCVNYGNQLEKLLVENAKNLNFIHLEEHLKKGTLIKQEDSLTLMNNLYPEDKQLFATHLRNVERKVKEGENLDDKDRICRTVHYLQFFENLVTQSSEHGENDEPYTRKARGRALERIRLLTQIQEFESRSTVRQCCKASAQRLKKYLYNTAAGNPPNNPTVIFLKDKVKSATSKKERLTCEDRERIAKEVVGYALDNDRYGKLFKDNLSSIEPCIAYNSSFTYLQPAIDDAVSYICQEINVLVGKTELCNVRQKLEQAEKEQDGLTAELKALRKEIENSKKVVEEEEEQKKLLEKQKEEKSEEHDKLIKDAEEKRLRTETALKNAEAVRRFKAKEKAEKEKELTKAEGKIDDYNNDWSFGLGKTGYVAAAGSTGLGVQGAAVGLAAMGGAAEVTLIGGMGSVLQVASAGVLGAFGGAFIGAGGLAVAGLTWYSLCHYDVAGNTSKVEKAKSQISKINIELTRIEDGIAAEEKKKAIILNKLKTCEYLKLTDEDIAFLEKKLAEVESNIKRHMEEAEEKRKKISDLKLKVTQVENEITQFKMHVNTLEIINQGAEERKNEMRKKIEAEGIGFPPKNMFESTTTTTTTTTATNVYTTTEGYFPSSYMHDHYNLNDFY